MPVQPLWKRLPLPMPLASKPVLADLYDTHNAHAHSIGRIVVASTESCRGGRHHGILQ